jgi:thiol-disulfide isomerase/thioredoxin
MKTRTFGIVIVVIVVAVAAVLAFTASRSSGSSSKAFEGQVIAPAAFKATAYTGKPLVINFFGSWCEYCKLEASDLATFAKGNPGAQVVGIASQDTEKDAGAFMTEYGLTYPLVVDDGSLTAKYGINGWPTTIFFNARGKEVERLVGASTLAQFDAALAKAQ